MQNLNVVFESGQLSFSDLEVDFYNSGVNQTLSVAAARGHNIFHFSARDVVSSRGIPSANMSVLSLPASWSGDAVDAYKHLTKVDERLIPFSEMHLCFMRADDIKPSTPGVDVLQLAEKECIFLEDVEDTLQTCDKYETILRCPDVPQPKTYAADSLDGTIEGVEKLPKATGRFVLKDRFGCGCGEQVHLLSFGDPDLMATMQRYVDEYTDVIVQEFCPEVSQGDLVATFFDMRLLGTMERLAIPGEWKTNASLGAMERGYDLPPDLEERARQVAGLFPGARFASVDMLKSGKVLEINTFPGGAGMYKVHGIMIGEVILNKLEQEARDRYF